MSYTEDHAWTDRFGRLIRFEVEMDIVAFVGSQVVGTVQFEERDGNPVLFRMDVDEHYRRAGIASEMMRHAVTVHGRKFGRPSFSATGGSGKASSEYFTIEGAAFFRNCILLGIIDDIKDPDDMPWDGVDD